MAVRLFLSYCHRDEKHRERLGVHLASLKQQGRIADWHDRKIVAGQHWEEEINNELLTADIVLLLISADFIASEYCYSQELRTALEREKRNEAVVIPIVVKPCDWKGAPFGYLQALPRDARPVTKWTNRDDAWSKVAEGIRAAVELFTTPAPPPPPRSPTFAREGPAPSTAPATIGEITSLTEARAILPDATPLSDTDMSSSFVGLHADHGQVVLKLIKMTGRDSARWLASPDYRKAVSDRLLETGQTETGRLYVLFRFVSGSWLSEMIRPGNVIRGALLDDITMQLLRQLAALNRVSPDAVHRDVTPSNVIFTTANGRALVRLIDYESGCFASDPQQAMRAYGYSAPEQAIGRAVPASDLFSLASTLYFFAEAKIPSVPAIEEKFSDGAFGMFTELEEVYGGESALLRCWDPDPARRPRSAEEFLSRQRTPSSRLMRGPKALGTFVCGKTTIDLFDQRYQVRG